MANSIDRHIGAAIRRRRQALGLSQVELARRLGVTIEHVKHYERGTARVDAATLLAMAKTLSMPVTAFFATIRCAGRS
jgi:transcriptional regulator with XRE-family HTH domain